MMRIPSSRRPKMTSRARERPGSRSVWLAGRQTRGQLALARETDHGSVHNREARASEAGAELVRLVAAGATAPGRCRVAEPVGRRGSASEVDAAHEEIELTGIATAVSCMSENGAGCPPIASQTASGPMTVTWASSGCEYAASYRSRSSTSVRVVILQAAIFARVTRRCRCRERACVEAKNRPTLASATNELSLRSPFSSRLALDDSLIGSAASYSEYAP